MLSNAGKKINRCQLAGSKTGLGVSRGGQVTVYHLGNQEKLNTVYHVTCGCEPSREGEAVEISTGLVVQRNSFHIMQEVNAF